MSVYPFLCTAVKLYPYDWGNFFLFDGRLRVMGYGTVIQCWTTLTLIVLKCPLYMHVRKVIPFYFGDPVLQFSQTSKGMKWVSIMYSFTSVCFTKKLVIYRSYITPWFHSRYSEEFFLVFDSENLALSFGQAWLLRNKSLSKCSYFCISYQPVWVSNVRNLVQSRVQSRSKLLGTIIFSGIPEGVWSVN